MADKIEIVIDGKDNAQGAFKSAAGGLGSLLGTATSFATGMGIFSLASSAIGGFGNVIKGAVTASEDEQSVMAQTQAVIQSTGDASGMSAQQIAAMANHLQDVTTFGNETVQAGENMLLTFTNIGSSVFPQATQAMLDMSQAMGTDPQQTAIQLGKALNDPVNGISALSRVGVTFTDQQKSVIAQMVKTGDVAGAQKVILGELNKEFGGSATAATKSFGGQMAQLKNQIGDAEKAISYALLPVLASLAQKVVPLIVQGFQWLGQVAPGAIQFVVDKVTALWSILSGPLQSAWVMVHDAVVTFAQALSGNWTDSSKIEGIHRAVGNLGLIIRNEVIPAVERLANFAVTQLWPVFQQVLGFMVDHWKQVSTVVATFVAGPLWPILVKLGVAIGENGLAGGLRKLPQILGQTFQSFTTVFGGILQYVGPILLQLGQQLVAWIEPQIGPILAALGDVLVQIGDYLINTGLPTLAQYLQQWGAQFIAWVQPQIGPLLTELGMLLEQLGGWIVNTALPDIIAKLSQWGQQFVAWVGPQIPPLLAELGKLLVQVGGWLIGTALPDLISKLGQWGLQFVQWVAPQIPPLMAELGKLEGQMVVWILTTAIPDIVTNLAKLAAKFVEWVASDVVPKLPGALNKIVDTINGWVAGILGWAGTVLVTIGEAVIQGLIDGIENMVKPLTDKLSSITSLIPKVKGPLDKDRQLLQPAGVAIMGGLMAGIASQIPALMAQMEGVTRSLSVGQTANSLFGGQQYTASAATGFGVNGQESANYTQAYRQLSRHPFRGAGSQIVNNIIIDGQVMTKSVEAHQESNYHTHISPHGVS